MKTWKYNAGRVLGYHWKYKNEYVEIEKLFSSLPTLNIHHAKKIHILRHSMSLNVMNVSLQYKPYTVKVSQITSYHATQHAKTLLMPVHKQHIIATSLGFSV